MTIKELKEKLNEYEFDEDVPVILFIESDKHLVMCSDFDVRLDADGEELYILGKESHGAVGVFWE
jgi:hypothetical protein